ncbi:hypothetical protein QBC37DRAFT_400582 [Rhypophila decipiens]|uniref:Uncharacterized protein n=1 Tax=Rhypophila decipiens TaxID=261697 RepID=A0AAN6Y8N0_9PEZI|nr:hypothetical protein QBC37DRAFT_400582 [Rhypophila decipiens]
MADEDDIPTDSRHEQLERLLIAATAVDHMHERHLAHELDMLQLRQSREFDFMRIQHSHELSVIERNYRHELDVLRLRDDTSTKADRQYLEPTDGTMRKLWRWVTGWLGLVLFFSSAGIATIYTTRLLLALFGLFLKLLGRVMGR